MLTSGQLLADRYRLARRIAVGGMGEVWEAADTRLDRRVAVKVLKPELCGDAEFLHRFRTEARTTASINHPGIAAVHDYGETAGVVDGPQDTAYLVMELVEGEPLAAILAKEGRLPADRTLDVLEQSAAALNAAHERGYVHRDVKPGNILITPSGVVKLTDFGIAKAADAAPVTRSGMVMGTAHYIAPEQALGHEAEPASDVYSLAVVGYECLTGHRPFLSENAVTVAMMHIRDIPPPLPADVPPGTRALIEATLVKDPRQRYANGGEFAVAVAAVRAGRPLPAPSGLALSGAHRGPAAGTHPGLAPVSGPLPRGPQPPFTPVPGHQQHREGRTGLWITIAVLAVALVAALAFGLPAILRDDQREDDGRVGGGAPTSSERAEPTGTTGAPVPPPGATPPSTSPVDPTDPEDGDQVRVDVEDYLGLTADQAAIQLGTLGLQTKVVTRQQQLPPADPSTCVVTNVTPNGWVERRSAVRVICDPQQNGPPG
ncbi:serine/threonine-protein kinase [Actinokineospora bangkokensis]|uniref:non-specific serine/threonine protein kinase n=1 Tax=Actinokineospora bangkokensis TaxID=1193682 RepID=A0A1Q9LU63_9PSEU|nr:serine/threonine-protein kinase [Actinokineospora bangkokensis]OLR95539.1 serine/threonine protein kinase [Actinokineospora bangkokensis]